MIKKVIDVSGYQGIINWGEVKASGIDGAILKVIRKDLNPDKQFENNWKGCQSAGIPIVGVYNYSYAATESKAISDARKVISILNGRKVKVWLDVEDDCQKKLGMTLVNIINAYKNTIEGAGLEFGVYTGISFYNSYIKKYSSLIHCNFWMARYPSSKRMAVADMPNANKKPSFDRVMEGWQYSSKGDVPGISGNVDLSIWYAPGEQSPQKTASSTVYGGLEYAPVFDAAYYVNKYTDLRAEYGTDAKALFTHFIVHGMKEGRQAIDTFRVQAYKERYHDLQKAFGENLPLYYQHYIQFGIAEKRSAL